MPLILPGNVASATASTTFSVANSCMFNDGDSAYMHVTRGSAGNQKTFTISMWIKRCELGASNYFFTVGPDGDTNFVMYFDASDQLEVWQYSSEAYQFRLKPTRVFRDCSAWYHICVAIDTTDATADDRVKIYINGVQETTMTTRTNPSEDLDTVMNDDRKYWLGKYVNAAYYFDGYIAELVVLDGTAASPTSFGEFDEDSPTIWKPIDVSGLTFGTNGFYLDFEDSANLGNDANGGTDLTSVNLDATDQATDTPTNNFCVMNLLENWAADNTFSEGNCMLSGAAAAWQLSSGTMGFSKGKWYWEVRYEGGTESYHSGVRDITANAFSNHSQAGCTTFYNADYGATPNSMGGEMFTGSDGGWTTADYGTMNTSSDVLGVACNFDDGQISYYVNGNIMVTNHALDSTTNNKNTLFPLAVQYTTNVTKYNFGGCSGFTVSSAVNDENGYGNFEYAPPSGYYALCTKNLAEFG